MPQLDSDVFIYSNGNLATVSGGKWTKLSGFADLVVTSNQLQGAGGGNDKVGCITAFSGSATNHYSQITVGTNAAFAGPTVHSNTGNIFYLFELNINGTQCQITLCNGGYSALSTFTAQVVGGDVAYLEWVSGVLTAKINGVTKGSVSDSSIASGKPGIRIFDSGSSIIVNAWAAGDFSAGGSGKPTHYYQQQRRRAA